MADTVKHRSSESRKIKSTVILVIMLISCLIGIVLSAYSLYVKMQKERDNSYKAMCDISQHMSCSAVFTSKYGKGFGLIDSFVGRESLLYQSNSIYGIIFYTIQAFLCLKSNPAAVKLQIFLSIVGNIGSVYLAYILYFILYDFCVVCVSTYVVNAVLLACGIYSWKTTKHTTKSEEKMN